MEKSIGEIKREIQAQEQRTYLKNSAVILNALKERFGDEVASVVEAAVCAQTVEEVKDIVRKREGNSLEDLIGMLFGPGTRKTHEFTIDRREDGYHVRITKCPIADLGRELGLSEWMYHLDCCKDNVIARSFNPSLGCRCIKTLTKGDDCCYQVYYEASGGEPKSGA